MADEGYGQQIFGSGYNPTTLQGGLAGLFSGIGQDVGKPYDKAIESYQNTINQGQTIQNPFYNAGTYAAPQFSDWLSKMRDPSAFIKHLMEQYQQSPWAKYQQQNNIRTANNLGSASGLTGSSALQEQAQKTGQDISSQDMQQWLQRVLGINSQVGQGWQNLTGIGANSANSLTNLLSDYGKNIGNQVYNREATEQNQTGNRLGGAATIAGMFLPKLLGA